jgi:hypothetical protein
MTEMTRQGPPSVTFYNLLGLEGEEENRSAFVVGRAKGKARLCSLRQRVVGGGKRALTVFRKRDTKVSVKISLATGEQLPWRWFTGSIERVVEQVDPRNCKIDGPREKFSRQREGQRVNDRSHSILDETDVTIHLRESVGLDTSRDVLCPRSVDHRLQREHRRLVVR